MFETYSESAQGVEIDHKRALRELKDHGFTDAESIADFEAEHGTGTHDAGQVLAWLGY